MKTLLIGISLLIASQSFAQSKKEQIAILTEQVAKYELENRDLKGKLSTCESELRVVKKTAQYSLKQIELLNARITELQDYLKNKETEKPSEDMGPSIGPKKPKNTQKSNDNPFGSFGSSGNGPGNGDGPGTLGTGSAEPSLRQQLNAPAFNHFEVKENCTIGLLLTIDADGKVVSAQNNKEKTTTTDQVLINKVITEVKRQVRYNKAPGATLAKVLLTIHLEAHEAH